MMSNINNILGVQDVTINTVAKHIRILSQNTIGPLDSNLQKISNSNSFSQKNESITEWLLEKKLSNKDVTNITWNVRQNGFDSLYEYYVSNLASNNNSVNDSPTEKQLCLLKSLGVISGVPKTKQEASEIIESILKNKPVTNKQREDLSALGISIITPIGVNSSDMPKNYSDAKKMIWDLKHTVSQKTGNFHFSENDDDYSEPDFNECGCYDNSNDISDWEEEMNTLGNEMPIDEYELAHAQIYYEVCQV